MERVTGSASRPVVTAELSRSPLWADAVPPRLTRARNLQTLEVGHAPARHHGIGIGQFDPRRQNAHRQSAYRDGRPRLEGIARDDEHRNVGIDLERRVEGNPDHDAAPFARNRLLGSGRRGALPQPLPYHRQGLGEQGSPL